MSSRDPASIPTPQPPLAALVGLDWADEHHDLCLLDLESGTLEERRLAHTPEAIAEWASGLERRFEGRAVGVCLELSRGPLVHALMRYDSLVLYPVNPVQLRRFREAFHPSGPKDDPTDAALLLELLSKHRDRLRAWRPDDEATRKLARLVEARRKAVDLRATLVQQLTAALKESFPQALEWMGENPAGPMACAFLLKWPTLGKLQRARPETIRRFYSAHNVRRGDLIEARLEAIGEAVPLTTDPAVIEPATMTVRMLVEQLRGLHTSIQRYETAIRRLFAAHPDAELFEALPGSGEALAPRLLVAFGTDRERFHSAREVQQLAGIAPVREASGKRSGEKATIRWRWNAPTFLRQTFHEFATHSIRSSRWARAYYEVQRERGKGHHAAVRALAFKWIRILYRCWKERTPYDEARYLRALEERGSPLAERLALAA